MFKRSFFRIYGCFSCVAFLVTAEVTSAQTGQGSLSTTYSYDALGRLVATDHEWSLCGEGQATAYDYDSAGNRESVASSADVISCVSQIKVMNAASVNEGSSLNFQFTRSGYTGGSSVISYNTSNGTAAAGSDYTARSGSVTFSAGQTSKTVSVVTIDDTVQEPNETVNLNISSSDPNVSITDSQGTGTIIYNDNPPTTLKAVSALSVTEGGTLGFQILREGYTGGSTLVNYATSNGTATAGSDYTAKSGSVTFSAGQTSKTISVLTINDTIDEPNETVRFNISSGTVNTDIITAQVTSTINDNDVPNSPPVANDDDLGWVSPGDYRYVFPLSNDSDANNDSLTIISVTQPSGGTVYINSSTSLYLTAGSYSGYQVFSYTISDGKGGTDTAAVSYFVNY